MTDVKQAGTLFPVILSGGMGTRLWPVSRALLPKQLLSLHAQRTMIQETVLRAALPKAAAPILICNNDHRFVVAEQMREIGVTPQALVLEPAGRNTAPAAAVAALMVAERDPEGIVLLLPSDHVVTDKTAFADAVAKAAAAARLGALVTFGIAPASPNTGYGYMRKGAPLPEAAGAFAIEQFVEKPDAAAAKTYLADGNYLWNSGMFVFQARTLIEEMARLSPDILRAARAAVEKSHRDLDFIRLDETAFAKAKSISLDYAVMERTARAAVVPAKMGWSDVGSWEALWEIGERDTDGNVLYGDVVAEDTAGSYIRAEKGLVAVLGVKDLVVVATDDAVLVAGRGRAEDVKTIVERLREAGRSEFQSHARVFRPWGDYQTIDAGDGFQVKHITVKPGGVLSLQKHHKRAEHWVVVQGTARVTCGDRVFLLKENESTFIPLGTKHRLENPGKVPLRLIEVQSGSYLGEDDIVRYEDVYGRA